MSLPRASGAYVVLNRNNSKSTTSVASIKNRNPYYRICMGIMGGKTEGIKHLVNEIKIDEGCRWLNGHPTVLYAAAEKGDDVFALFLLQKGADPNVGCPNVPLWIAVKNGHVKVVEVLINNGASVDPTGRNMSSSPLSIAVESGRIGMVPFLIKKKANINCKDLSGNRPIAHAIKNGYEMCTRTLLRSGASASEGAVSGYSIICGVRDPSPLHLAAGAGVVEIAKIILEYKVDINQKIEGESPLSVAFKKKNYNFCSFLLEKGANFDALSIKCIIEENQESFFVKCVKELRKNNDEELFLAILESAVLLKKTDFIKRAYTLSGMDSEKKLLTSLAFELLEEVKSKRTDIRIDDEKRLNALRFLLEEGVDVNAIVSGQRTLLHVAAKTTPQIISLLIKNGAVVDVLGHIGDTPLFEAARIAKLENIRILIELGADIYHCNSEGTNILWISALSGPSIEALRYMKSNFDSGKCKVSFEKFSEGFATTSELGNLKRMRFLASRTLVGKLCQYERNVKEKDKKLIHKKIKPKQNTTRIKMVSITKTMSFRLDAFGDQIHLSKVARETIKKKKLYGSTIGRSALYQSFMSFEEEMNERIEKVRSILGERHETTLNDLLSHSDLKDSFKEL